MSKQINAFLIFLCHVCGGKYWTMWYDMVCNCVCTKHYNKVLNPRFYMIFYGAGYLQLQILIKHWFVVKR